MSSQRSPKTPPAAVRSKRKAVTLASDADVVLKKCRALRDRMRRADPVEPDPQPAGVPRDIVEVADLTSKQVLEAMEAVALKVAQQVLSKKGFSFDIPSRASSNQIYVRDWDRIVLGGKRTTRSFLNAKENRKSAITLRVMQLLHSVYVTIIRYFGRCMPAVLGFSPGCLNFMADCANPFM